MTENPYPERRHTRLDLRLYAETGHICSVTISTLRRTPVFSGDVFARACIDLLKARADAASVQVHAYCFMPDHVHLLISPGDQKSIVDFVREFKSLSSRLAWQNGIQGKIWQEGFYDHFLRRDEDLELAVNYILNNPVRAGIVGDPMSYPYSGSLVYVLETPGGGGQATRPTGPGVPRE